MIWETVPAPLGFINGSSRLELKRLFFEKPTTAQVDMLMERPGHVGKLGIALARDHVKALILTVRESLSLRSSHHSCITCSHDPPLTILH